MRIVDKYELAECPAGTPFFVLNNKYWNPHDPVRHYSPDGGSIEDAMQIKISDTFYTSDGEAMFNGVAYIQLENCSNDSDPSEFTNDTLPSKIELVRNDTDSNDFTDEDRFLVLNSTEFRSVIDELEEYYLMLKKNEEIDYDEQQ